MKLVLQFPLKYNIGEVYNNMILFTVFILMVRKTAVFLPFYRGEIDTFYLNKNHLLKQLKLTLPDG